MSDQEIRTGEIDGRIVEEGPLSDLEQQYARQKFPPPHCLHCQFWRGVEPEFTILSFYDVFEQAGASEEGMKSPLLDQPPLAIIEWNGNCHRYPPTIQPQDDEQTMFPWTKHNDWCGEFQERVQ